MIKITNVPVLSCDGKPLMPTTQAYARILLKRNKAKVVDTEIFTIKLLQENKPSAKKHEVTLGLDVGFSNIGYSVRNDEQEFIGGTLEMLEGMSERITKKAMHRKQRNSRKRYRAARFDNRKKETGWLAPTIQHKNNTHDKIIEKLCNLFPVTVKVFEIGNFDTKKMVAPKHDCINYQEAYLEYKGNLRNSILFRDDYTCQLCNKNLFKDANVSLQVHHIIFESKGGTNKPSNLITLCTKCHTQANHKEGGVLYQWMIESKKVTKSLKEATYMNILASRLKEKHDFIQVFGYQTSVKRKNLGLEKSHSNDAFVISGGTTQIRAPHQTNFKQKRRHNRSLETFKDAKYIDIRSAESVDASVLNCGRRRRNKNLNTENLRVFRGKKMRKGVISRRLRTYKFESGDKVRYKGKLYTVRGNQNQGTRMKFKETGDKTYLVKDVVLHKANVGTYVD